MPIFVGIDVAKETHWVCALDQDARVVLDRAAANDQAALDVLAAELRGLGPELTIALDVTGSIASFLEAVLLAEGFALVHVPGMAVNRAGHGFAVGERKSDPKDARTIAELARTPANTLKPPHAFSGRSGAIYRAGRPPLRIGSPREFRSAMRSSPKRWRGILPPSSCLQAPNIASKPSC